MQNTNLQIQNSNSTGNWDYQTIYPSYPYWQPYPVYTNIVIDRVVEPKECIGKAHIFECEHVKACKCGKIKCLPSVDV